MVRRRGFGDHDREEPRQVELARASSHQPHHPGHESEVRVLGLGLEVLVHVVGGANVDHRGKEQLLAREVVQQPGLADPGAPGDRADAGAAIATGGELRDGGGEDARAALVGMAEPASRAGTTGHNAPHRRTLDGR
jgi:hypothetical protein